MTASFIQNVRKGRNQAKRHLAEKAEQAKHEQQEASTRLPYRHVPTHAYSDAISSAPPSWRDDDRTRIRELNRSRNEMMASGIDLVSPNVGSSLSVASYKTAYGTPIPVFPRNYDYPNVPSPWRDGSNAEGDGYFNDIGNRNKGKDVARPFQLGHLGIPSRMPSERVSLRSYQSVTNAGGIPRRSEDEPESRGELQPQVSRRNSGHSDATHHTLHRLHPSSQPRKSSDVSKQQAPDRYYPPPAKSTFYSTPRTPSSLPLNKDMPTPFPPSMVPPSMDNFIISGVTSAANSNRNSDSSSDHERMTVRSTAPTSISPSPTPSNAGEQVSSAHKNRTASIASSMVSTDAHMVQGVPSKTRRRLSKSKQPQAVQAGTPKAVQGNPGRTASGSAQPSNKPPPITAATTIRELHQPPQSPSTPEARKTLKKLNKPSKGSRTGKKWWWIFGRGKKAAVSGA
ncbi:hypothetical protein F4778DRAFT_210761 [Xylariomycetidae sp. FL2044]|nr:hypothetical protein F4778DRAFT_210761 [Xylariomycetidae sp. FL2044]